MFGLGLRLNLRWGTLLQHCSLLSCGRYPTALWGARVSLQVSSKNCLCRFGKLLTTHN